MDSVVYIIYVCSVSAVLLKVVALLRLHREWILALDECTSLLLVTTQIARYRQTGHLRIMYRRSISIRDLSDATLYDVMIPS